jgi:hypothetical protein
MTIMPGTKSSRVAYPPTVPAGFVDPGGATPADRAYRTQKAVAKAYSDWRAAHSPDISPDVLQRNAGAFAVSDAALALPGVLDAVKDDAKDATRKSLDLVRNNRVDGDTASQVGAQRFWTRAQRQLESIREPSKVLSAVQDLIDNATDAEIPVLSEELPLYLSTRNVPATALMGALAARIPGLQEAQSDERVKARQHAILQQNHHHLVNAINKDVAAPPLLSPLGVDATPYTDTSN